MVHGSCCILNGCGESIVVSGLFGERGSLLGFLRAGIWFRGKGLGECEQPSTFFVTFKILLQLWLRSIVLHFVLSEIFEDHFDITIEIIQRLFSLFT